MNNQGLRRIISLGKNKLMKPNVTTTNKYCELVYAKCYYAKTINSEEKSFDTNCHSYMACILIEVKTWRVEKIKVIPLGFGKSYEHHTILKLVQQYKMQKHSLSSIIYILERLPRLFAK